MVVVVSAHAVPTIVKNATTNATATRPKRFIAASTLARLAFWSGGVDKVAPDRLQRERLALSVCECAGDLGRAVDSGVRSLTDPSREPAEGPRVEVLWSLGCHEGEKPQREVE